MKYANHYWLPVATIPARFQNIVIVSDQIYVRVSWRVVYLALLRAIADTLATLAAFIVLELAHGRGWQRGRARQLSLWKVAA